MKEKILNGSIMEALKKFIFVHSRFEEKQTFIRWELLDLEHHLTMIDEWVHFPYAKTFWQMDHLSSAELHEHYKQVLQSPYCISLIGHFKNQPVCQVELYDCFHDEICRYYTPERGDTGLHFLMAPVSENKISGLSVTMMRSILGLILRCPEIVRVMGEPDIRNTRANNLVRKAGFVFIKQITMSYKLANLYACTKDSLTKQN